MRNQLKQGLLIALLLAAVLSLAACSPTPQPEPQPEPLPEVVEPAPEAEIPTVEMRVATLKGPTGIAMVQMMSLMEHSPDGLYHNPLLVGFDESDLSRSYEFQLLGAPEDVVALLVSGNVDIAAVPSNLASNLYAVTEGEIQMIGITTYGTLYLLEAGDTIESWEDLRGQTVYATGQGANPEYILMYLLAANGLTPGIDVQVEFLTEHAELATLLAEGQLVLGMLPEPNVTAAMMQNEELRVVFDLTEEWAKVAQGGLAMSCVVARRDFVEANPQAVANFLFDLETSINFVLDDVQAAAELCQEFGVIPQAALAQRAIPNCNLTMISGADMQGLMEPYLQILFEANPQSVGGAVPDQGLYYVPQS